MKMKLKRKPQKKPKKVYMIMEGEKRYIDPEIVKKYNLENRKTSFFSGRKLYFEDD